MITEAIQRDLRAAQHEIEQRRANLGQAIADKRWDDALNESGRLRYALGDLDFAIKRIQALQA